MKIGVIFFHKNILGLYKKRWIIDSVNSILNQTYNDFTIYEINYGDNEFSLSFMLDFKKFKHNFYNVQLTNYAEAQNFLLKKAIEDGCDYVFNTNLDDISYENRIEKQIEYVKNNKIDIFSTDMEYVVDKNGTDIVVKDLNFRQYDTVEKIKEQFKSENNIIAHPTVMYSSDFIKNNTYDIKKTPEEDFFLWKKTIDSYNFKIYPEILLKYRLHENQVSNKK